MTADELHRPALYTYGHFTTMRVDAELDPATVCRFGSANPAVHRELDAVLRVHRVTGGSGWLIDILALTRLRRQTAVDPDQPATANGSAVKTRGD